MPDYTDLGIQTPDNLLSDAENIDALRAAMLKAGLAERDHFPGNEAYLWTLKAGEVAAATAAAASVRGAGVVWQTGTPLVALPRKFTRFRPELYIPDVLRLLLVLFALNLGALAWRVRAHLV